MPIKPRACSLAGLHLGHATSNATSVSAQEHGPKHAQPSRSPIQIARLGGPLSFGASGSNVLVQGK